MISQKKDITFEEIESFAFGELNLLPNEFYSISPRHLSLMMKGNELKKLIHISKQDF